jgi:hypothetical protein
MQLMRVLKNILFFIWGECIMLKSCSYCGKIHDTKYVCPSKPKRKYKKEVTQADKFRWTKAWQNKRKQINIRDNYVCQICSRELHNTYGSKYNFDSIHVHHIDSIATAWDRRLDDSNLICLCQYHHKMAEDGLIGKQELFDIVQQQESL